MDVLGSAPALPGFVVRPPPFRATFSITERRNKACSAKPGPFCLALIESSEEWLGNDGAALPLPAGSHSAARWALNGTNAFFCSLLSLAQLLGREVLPQP